MYFSIIDATFQYHSSWDERNVIYIYICKRDAVPRRTFEMDEDRRDKEFVIFTKIK